LLDLKVLLQQAAKHPLLMGKGLQVSPSLLQITIHPNLTTKAMNNKTFMISLVAAMAMTACSKSAQDSGVTVEVKNQQANTAHLVRLQAITPTIIRVSATADSKFADRQSLVIVPQAEQPHYTTSQEGDVFTLATDSLQAHVSQTDGRVWFTDLSGNELLSEQADQGKRFTYYQCTQTHADGTPETYHGWSTQVIFDSPADEAFYGLGQHQADDWNYKGKNEELFQYNTKVSIPFVVSSRNYGILLDSYSLCRFGNPDDYQQLQKAFTLYDKEGVKGALTGTYSAPDQETLVRREDSLYFENLKSAKNLPQFPLGNATVVYEGEIEPSQSGEYRFSHYYSGYQRIYIDDKSVYTENVNAQSDDQEIWRTAWNPNARKFNVTLEAGKRYKIRVEWKPDGGEAYCGLRAMTPRADKDQQQLSLWSEMTQQLDYYFISGHCSDDVIHGYRQLTGKAQIMPKWLLGYWQSRERYKTQAEVLDALQGFRDRQLPIDNIVIDWNYWVPSDWGAFEFDTSRFPTPKEMIDTIHQQHAKVMISCWPKYYLTVDNFKELNDRGLIYQQSIRDSMYDWLGYKYAFYDAYDGTARKIFWRQLYEKLGVLGMDAWWMDASEPNVRDCTDMEYRKLLCGPTALGSSDEYFNAYSIPNAEAIYDGQRGYETTPALFEQAKAGNYADNQPGAWNQLGYGNQFSPDNQRVFLLTRSGFLGEQRFSTATWSGDIGTRWEDMKAQITAGLNFSISGIPFWSMDIGGFSVEKRYEAAQREFDATGKETADLADWRELNARWHQFGAFAPMYRSHGQFPFREPWNIAPASHPAYKSIQYYLELRYRLMPYLYSLTADVHFNDYTIMRPLVMDFGRDTETHNIGYQFMFGPSIMVNPVYTYKARQREVYFPKEMVNGKLSNCTWYDFYTGQVASQGGERKTVAAPYERIPLYVRAGSILPIGPMMQYSDEKPADVIRLYVYKGKNGTFRLYEDEGTNYGYEAGRYAEIPFTYDEAKQQLTIGQRKGEFPGMLKERTFIIVPVSATAAAPYDPEATGTEVRYIGSSVTVSI